MIAKKNLLRRLEPLRQLIRNRIAVLPAALCLAGSLFAPPAAWAGEPARGLAALASSQLAVLEPGPHLLGLVRPPSIRLTPERKEPAAEIDLEHIQDLDSIIDDARKQAQVEYLAEKLRKSPQAVKQYVHLAWAEASRRDGLSPELLIAIMYRESTFQPKVQSRYGAQGLMQVVRRWHREKLRASESLFDPAVNVRVGADILEEYLEAAEGDLPKALAKDSGSSRGYAKRVLSESRRLAQIADTAAADVVLTSWPLDEPSAGFPG